MEPAEEDAVKRFLPLGVHGVGLASLDVLGAGVTVLNHAVLCGCKKASVVQRRGSRHMGKAADGPTRPLVDCFIGEFSEEA